MAMKASMLLESLYVPVVADPKWPDIDNNTASILSCLWEVLFRLKE